MCVVSLSNPGCFVRRQVQVFGGMLYAVSNLSIPRSVSRALEIYRAKLLKVYYFPGFSVQYLYYLRVKNGTLKREVLRNELHRSLNASH